MSDVAHQPVRASLGAFVVACAYDAGGTVAAFALGDGTLRLTDLDGGAWQSVAAHDGAVLALATDILPGGFLTGGDDGRFVRITADGSVIELGSFGGKWVEQVAAAGDAKSGYLACAAGKQVHLFDPRGTALRAFAHPSTVTGLAFDARGKRLAASHYGGASLWFAASKSEAPRKLEWKGSHIGIAMHPAAEAVVTATQENELHGWRLPEGADMRMSGYPTKTESLAFTRGGKWLATSGADAVVLWPFFGGGPTGKAPRELGGGTGVVCTRVAAHPKLDMLAAGYADGSVTILDLTHETGREMIEATGDPVSALQWSPDGFQLAFGTEGGTAGLIELPVLL